MDLGLVTYLLNWDALKFTPLYGLSAAEVSWSGSLCWCLLWFHSGFLPYRSQFSFVWLPRGMWEGLSYGEAPATGKIPPVQQCQNQNAHKEVHCQANGSELHKGNVLLLRERRLELKTHKPCQVLQITLSLQLIQPEKCFKNELWRKGCFVLFADKSSWVQAVVCRNRWWGGCFSFEEMLCVFVLIPGSQIHVWKSPWIWAVHNGLCMDILRDDCMDNFRPVLMSVSVSRSLYLTASVGKQSSLWLAYGIPNVMVLATVAASLSSPSAEHWKISGIVKLQVSDK